MVGPGRTAARETDVGVRSIPLQYAERGQSYDVEGTNRNVNVALAAPADRRAANEATPDDPDLLPGPADVAAPDSADGAAGHGHLWDAAIKAGLTVRNYGFHLDTERYERDDPHPLPVLRDPVLDKNHHRLCCRHGPDGSNGPVFSRLRPQAAGLLSGARMGTRIPAIRRARELRQTSRWSAS